MKVRAIKSLAMVAVACCIWTGTVAQATVVYDESISGDAPDDSNPFNLGSLLPGNYQLIGGNTEFDHDCYSFTIDFGYELDAIMVDSYTGFGLASIQVPFLGGSTMQADRTGQNFLTLANIPQPVLAGTYMFRTLAGLGTNTYRYSFVVNAVPEPATLSLFTIGALAILLRRKR